MRAGVGHAEALGRLRDHPDRRRWVEELDQALAGGLRDRHQALGPAELAGLPAVDRGQQAVPALQDQPGMGDGHQVVDRDHPGDPQTGLRPAHVQLEGTGEVDQVHLAGQFAERPGQKQSVAKPAQDPGARRRQMEEPATARQIQAERPVAPGQQEQVAVLLEEAAEQPAEVGPDPPQPAGRLQGPQVQGDAHAGPPSNSWMPPLPEEAQRMA